MLPGISRSLNNKNIVCLVETSEFLSQYFNLLALKTVPIMISSNDFHVKAHERKWLFQLQTLRPDSGHSACSRLALRNS